MLIPCSYCLASLGDRLLLNRNFKSSFSLDGQVIGSGNRIIGSGPRTCVTVFSQLKHSALETSGDTVLTANAENTFKVCKTEKDALEIFKKDLGTFVRFYEFMSQIVDYDNKDLEKLCLFARNLRPMLRERAPDEEDINLNSVVLSHYRLSKIRQQDLLMKEHSPDYQLHPGDGLGTSKAKDKKEEFLSQIIQRLNELFITDELTEADMVNYAYTVRDKVRENDLVMSQLTNNPPAQALLGDFPGAVDDAILSSSDAHHNQKLQLLTDPRKAEQFKQVIFDLLMSIPYPQSLRAQTPGLHPS